MKVSDTTATTCKPCGKRVFESARHARLAHTKAHFRIRVYRCPHGNGYHATNAEKG